MKKILVALALLAVGTTAFADTDFSFYAATDGTYTCPTYCIGFATSDPAHTVDYVNMMSGTITISVDGVVYKQAGIISPFAVNGATFDINYTSRRTCVRIGNDQHCTTRYFANSGTVSLP